MKTLKLILEIEFSEKINTDEEINEVAENVRKALVHAVDTSGLSPEGSDAYTKEISITCPYNNLEILHAVDGNNNKEDKVAYIKGVIKEWGAFSVADIEGESSPVYAQMGKNNFALMEKFSVDDVNVVNYVHDSEVDDFDVRYENLTEDQIDEIVTLVEQYEADMLKTEKRISN
jgi:hypothetical protein